MEQNLEHDVRLCEDAINRLRETMDQCRSMASQAKTPATITILYAAGSICEALATAVEKSEEISRETDSGEKAA
jgi:hypothetical protein